MTGKEIIGFRVSKEKKKELERRAEERGFSSVSDLMRYYTNHLTNQVDRLEYEKEILLNILNTFTTKKKIRELKKLIKQAEKKHFNV